tara:strand:- start:230 stop:2209 length:1980 start_codon:yes stop_codon:yes gene_type:complete
MDTVQILNGIYTGGVTIDNKPITLMGESSVDTKLNVPITDSNIAVLNNTDTVRIENLKIKRGNAVRGGAIRSSNSIVVAKNLDLSSNMSLNGGAIYIDQSTFFLVDASVYLNSCDSMGGAIYVQNSQLELSDVEMNNNSGYFGGAIYMDSSSVVAVNNSDFLNNGAFWGGAISTIGAGKLEISESFFNSNTANGWDPASDPDFPSYGGGGAIYQEFADTLHITGTAFTINNATSAPGGAIASYHGTEIILDDLHVANNNANGGAGGGLMLLRPEHVIFSHSLIENNRSNVNSGGGVMLGSESIVDSIVVRGSFNHLTFVNNYAQIGGGGLFLWNTADFDILHCTFVGNEANDNDGTSTWLGGGLAIHAAAEANVLNSLFYDNYPNSVHDGTPNSPFEMNYTRTTEYWAGDGNITEDPLFVDAESFDFRLQVNSPCIDAGTSDLDGDGFEDLGLFYTGSAPDLGAYEWVIAAPQDLQAYVQDSTVLLAWGAVEENLQFYKLERSTNDIFTENVSENFLTTNTFTDNDLEWDTEYFYRVSANVGYYTDYSNISSVMLESLNIEDNEYLPLSFQVFQNYPNPFNPTTSLSYQLPDDGKVEVVIYDMMGKLIKNLVNEKQSSGQNSIIWNATNNSGNQVSAGLYIYTVKTRNHKQSKKMLLLK